jgi:hypothetical protein
MKLVIDKVERGKQAAADLAFWLSQPMADRIAAVEALRQQAFGSKVPSDAEHRSSTLSADSDGLIPMPTRT